MCIECYTNDVIDKLGFTDKVAASVYDSGNDPDANEVCKNTEYC